MSNSNPNKKLLYEVSYIRPIVIFLLVFLHAFTKIQRGAGYENEYTMPSIYEWMCRFISGFRIEMIAMVAGYVFAYQSIDLHRSYDFWPFVVKKFRRLILPMLFYGIIYYFMFFFDRQHFSIVDFHTKVLSGCGHLWFLPMLFWSFISIWVIDHFKIVSFSLFLVLAIFSLTPSLQLPFGLARYPHFLFYVYGGYYLWGHRQFLLHRNSIISILTSWALYVILVVISLCLVPTYGMGGVISVVTKNILDLIISIMGIIALYKTICHFTNSVKFQPKTWVVAASSVCYGVYVYHQFITTLLYRNTALVNAVNTYVLPWLGFITALVISLVLTKLTLMTKFGRELIG